MAVGLERPGEAASYRLRCQQRQHPGGAGRSPGQADRRGPCSLHPHRGIRGPLRGYSRLAGRGFCSAAKRRPAYSVRPLSPTMARTGRLLAAPRKPCGGYDGSQIPKQAVLTTLRPRRPDRQPRQVLVCGGKLAARADWREPVVPGGHLVGKAGDSPVTLAGVYVPGPLERMPVSRGRSAGVQLVQPDFQVAGAVRRSRWHAAARG